LTGGASSAPNPRALFAELINAKPTEIAYVSSTSEGENLVGRREQRQVGLGFTAVRMRLSPSVYNDMADVDRFLEALG
jgi:selenocysteine lyase/cysteine desulfurase